MNREKLRTLWSIKIATHSIDCNMKLPSSGILEEKSLIIAVPAVFREYISLMSLKVLPEVFIKVFQVIFTEQALKQMHEW